MSKQVTDDDSSLFFIALGANGTFSLVCGISMAIASTRIATFVGVPDSRWILALGIGLVVFGAVLLLHYRRKSISRIEAILISVMDFAWVLTSIAIVVLLREYLTANAIIAILAVAAIVLTFFDLQAYALWRSTTEPAK